MTDNACSLSDTFVQAAMLCKLIQCVLCFRLGKKPWTTWPTPPETPAERKHEDVLHTLGRIMESSCFQTPPEVQQMMHSALHFYVQALEHAG